MEPLSVILGITIISDASTPNLQIIATFVNFLFPQSCYNVVRNKPYFSHSSLRMPHSITTVVHGSSPSDSTFHLARCASSADGTHTLNHHVSPSMMSPWFSPPLSPERLLRDEPVIPKQEEEDHSFQRGASAQLDGVYDLVSYRFRHPTFISLASSSCRLRSLL